MTTAADVGTVFELRAVSADENTLVILQGAQSHKEFWAVDLRSGAQHALTDLGPGQIIGDFDVAADGRTIVFDRVREESDLALIELAAAR